MASIQTFAQSPRIKLNQITKDSVTGSVLISSPTDSGMVYSRDLFISYGADTVLILGGDTLAKTSGIISSVLSDGVTITGDGTTGSELTADTSVLATLRALSDSLALVISSVTADNVTITGDGTVGSPLKVDTATVVATKQDLDLYYLDSNPDGYTSNTGTVTSVGATAGTGISVSGSPITTSGTLTITNTAPDQTVSIAGGGINAVTGTYPSFTVTGTEVDGSISNEGSLTVGAGTASTSVISSNTSGSTDVTLTAGTNVTLSETGNNITISATGGGTTYNNISETADTVYISDYLDVDTATLYVDANNNRVGIGTTSPQGRFTIKDGAIHLTETSVGVGSSTADNPLMYVYESTKTTSGATDTEFAFFAAGPGSTSTNDGPIFNMRGNNFSRFANARGVIFFGAGNVSSPVGDDGTITFNTSGTNRMQIEADGDVVMSNDAFINGTTPVTSDFNLKNNINDYNAGLDKIMKLRSVSFYLNNDKNNSLNFGYIAQEVQDILPELIRQNNNTGYLYLVYENFIPIITNAIQEQQAIIESQSTEIEKLKTLITELSNRLTILENN